MPERMPVPPGNDVGEVGICEDQHMSGVLNKELVSQFLHEGGEDRANTENLEHVRHGNNMYNQFYSRQALWMRLRPLDPGECELSGCCDYYSSIFSV